MIVRQPSAQPQGLSGTLEGVVPVLVVDMPEAFSSERKTFRSIDDLLGIDQQVAWIEGTLRVSF